MEQATPGATPPTVCCSQIDPKGACALDPTLPDPFNKAKICCRNNPPGSFPCFSTVPSLVAVPPVCCHQGTKCISDVLPPGCCAEAKVCQSAAAAKAVCCGEKQQCMNGVCQLLP
jgi:hypothetical protein